jgi:hypothetical protein
MKGYILRNWKIIQREEEKYTILSRLQTPTWKFAECVSNLQKKYVRMIVFLYLQDDNILHHKTDHNN